jgi:hypothetical protein
MENDKSVEQTNDVFELALDDIEIVGGGFPIVPPNGG